MLFLAFGVLKSSHKLHLGVAIFMTFTVLVQAILMKQALDNPEHITVPIPPNPWFGFFASAIPHILALISSLLLFLRKTET